MMLSHMLHWNKETFKQGVRPSWKTAALFGIPVFVFGVAGLSYYVYKRRHSPSCAVEPIPKTPLETAIALKNRGNKYFKAGQYAKAVELYNEGIDQCPIDAITERAALFQNRAAAKENLRQYDSAVTDCTSALEYSPRYLKALNRRSHLYEKLESLESCLSDVVACCIFEEFKNTDNIIRMDQILKKIGLSKAQEEWKSLAHTLPSAAFIRNYLGAFAWNPFEVTPSTEKTVSMINGTMESNSDVSQAVNGTDELESDPVDDRLGAVEPIDSAYSELDKALNSLTSENYEASMASASAAVAMFEKIFSLQNPGDSANHMAEGDEVTSPDTDKVPGSADVVDGHREGETVSVRPLSPDQLTRAKTAHAKALLLYATFLALSGRAAEAKSRFQTVCADGSGADVVVRVNALIKSACLSMSVDQDFAACLYDFQNAQNACPECPDVYLHRGQINLLADQLDEALHDLNTAVKLKPEFSIAQAQRLYTLYRKALNDSDQGRALSRVDEFRRLAQKYPNCVETHSLFAQVLTEREDFDASDEEFAKVIELSPNSGLAYAHRGLLQLRWKQDREAARKWFTLGIKADPKCELIHELLGQLAVEQGDFPAALNHFDLAIREAKTQNDLAHLVALREGVKAQSKVCEKYGISMNEVSSALKREQQQMMMASW